MTPPTDHGSEQQRTADARPDDRLVVGVDIGTTGTKAVAYDSTGEAHAHATVTYPLDSPQPGYA